MSKIRIFQNNFKFSFPSLDPLHPCFIVLSDEEKPFSVFEPLRVTRRHKSITLVPKSLNLSLTLPIKPTCAPLLSSLLIFILHHHFRPTVRPIPWIASLRQASPALSAPSSCLYHQAANLHLCYCFTRHHKHHTKITTN